MPGKYDIMLWGVYYCDLIFTGLPRVPTLGTEVWSGGFEVAPGGPYTTTVAMQRLGLRVGWMCDFGTDEFSQVVLEAAKREGLDDQFFHIHSYPVRRISVVFSVLGDRGFLSFVDDVEQTSAIPAIEKHRPRCVMLPILYYGEVHSALVAAARRAGAMLFMDCQGIEVTLETPGVVDALRSVDIFAPNELEALQLTGAATVEGALARLAELTPLVIIKLGADGAICRRGGQVVHAPAIQVNVVDPTGAGDCFNAGFLHSYLGGASLETCMQSGNICGGIATTAVGAATVAPTAAQVEGIRSGLIR